ncbi:MAG TPA: AAA family ATPase, partial [Verrucomicrobiae bacterium]|nr:AAA family ATPase [Verrucomicrobiae bacterium]
DGRLTDGQGRTVDFKNTMIIMTSNIGSPIIQEYFDAGRLEAKDKSEMEQRVKSELRGHFRPEFLNRIDDIIVFHRLDEKQITHIVDIQLERVAQRLAQQHLSLTVEKSAKQLVARQGYDPQFGARPLKRTIQELLLDPLATKILKGDFKPGETIRVTSQGDEIIFEK